MHGAKYIFGSEREYYCPGEPKMKLIIVTIFIAAVPLLLPASFISKVQAGELAAISRFDGVWDSYGSISCREGIARPNALKIRNGNVRGTIDTTDLANRMLGKIDRFGRMTVYVTGNYTLMTFKAAVIGNEGYGPAEVEGDDVDCNGAWAVKRRSDPSIKGVHFTPDGARARIDLDFVSRANSWHGQREFMRLYESFAGRIEINRLKYIMSQ